MLLYVAYQPDQAIKKDRKESYACVCLCVYLMATEREGIMAVARAERMDGLEKLRGLFMAL